MLPSTGGPDIQKSLTQSPFEQTLYNLAIYWCQMETKINTPSPKPRPGQTAMFSLMYLRHSMYKGLHQLIDTRTPSS